MLTTWVAVDGGPMCDNCEEGRVAYTLRTHVDGAPDRRVDLEFCSIDCLREWT